MKANIKAVFEELGVVLMKEARLIDDLLGHIDDLDIIPVQDTDRFITWMGEIAATVFLDHNIAAYPLIDFLVMYLEGICYLAFPEHGTEDQRGKDLWSLGFFTCMMNSYIDKPWVAETDEAMLTVVSEDVNGVSTPINFKF